MKSQTKKQPNAKDNILSALEIGEIEIRTCLDAEGEAGWATAEAVAKQHDYIISQTTCSPSSPEWSKQLAHIIGQPSLDKYFRKKFDLSGNFVNTMMRSLKLYRKLAPPTHIKMSPSGIYLGLAGVKGEEEQLVVLTETIKAVPADGRVGVKTIRKAAKAFLEAKKAKEEAENPNPDSPAMAKVRAIVKPLYAATAITDKMFVALINGIDLPAIESAINIVADVAERYRGYHESLIEYRDRIKTQSAQPEAKPTPKRKRKPAPPPEEEEERQAA